MILALGPASAGCGRGRDERHAARERPVALPAGGSPGTTQATPMIAGAPPVECARALPPALRERWMPGMTFTQVAACAGCPEMCRFVRAGHPGITVVYDCRAPASDDDIRADRDLLLAQKRELALVPDLGRAALAGPGQVLFWDGDTGCYVTVSWPGGGADLLSLARAVETALVPALVHRQAGGSAGR